MQERDAAGTSQDWISKRAYALWEQAGQPQGRDQEHWLQAENEHRQMLESAENTVVKAKPRVAAVARKPRRAG